MDPVSPELEFNTLSLETDVDSSDHAQLLNREVQDLTQNFEERYEIAMMELQKMRKKSTDTYIHRLIGGAEKEVWIMRDHERTCNRLKEIRERLRDECDSDDDYEWSWSRHKETISRNDYFKNRLEVILQNIKRRIDDVEKRKC